MARLRLHAANVLALLGLLVAGIVASGALATPGTPAAGGPPSTVPGSPGDDCSHGNSEKDCRPDPNENGKDCEDHGNARGNEDHCEQAPITTTTSTTNDTSTTTSTSTTTTTSTSSTTSTDSSTTTTTSSTPSTTTTDGGGSTTTTTSQAPATEGVADSTSTPLTKPELQKELASQVQGVRGARASAAPSGPRELPFTGFPAWAVALIGSAMLLTGVGLRRVAS